MNNPEDEKYSLKLLLLYYLASLLFEALVFYIEFFTPATSIYTPLYELFSLPAGLLFVLFNTIIHFIIHLCLNHIMKRVLKTYNHYKVFQLTILASLATYTTITIPFLETAFGPFWWFPATPFASGVMYYLLYWIGKHHNKKRIAATDE